LAEALEAAECYARAAPIYTEAALASEALHGLKQAVATANMNAGVAWRRAGDAKQAEEAYVLAMHKFVQAYPKLSGAALVHHEFIDCLLENLSTAYDQHLIAHGATANLSGRRVNPSADEVIPHISVTLGALMAAAGFNSFRNFKAAIKGLRKTRRRDAIATLASAIKSGPSVRAFRCVLLDAIREYMTDVAFPQGVTPVPTPRENASIARDVVKATAAKTIPYVRCGGCHTLMPERSQAGSCPCKQVSYCSKECQKLHWPVHKLVCPLRKPKPAKPDVSAAADAVESLTIIS
jgi:hypothetical protein